MSAAMWLENQFDLEPYPGPEDQTLSQTLAIVGRAFGKSYQQFVGAMVSATSQGKYTLWPPPLPQSIHSQGGSLTIYGKDGKPQSTHKVNHVHITLAPTPTEPSTELRLYDRDSRGRPPQSPIPNQNFDRRGRKLY